MTTQLWLETTDTLNYINNNNHQLIRGKGIQLHFLNDFWEINIIRNSAIHHQILVIAGMVFLNKSVPAVSADNNQ